MSPLWRRGHGGASPALSAITAAEFSPYHMESASLLHTPGGSGRRARRELGEEDDDEDFMDISSAARDLRELSQIAVEERVGPGPGGARAPPSADMGRSRSGGFKAGRIKGWFCELVYFIYSGGEVHACVWGGEGDWLCPVSAGSLQRISTRHGVLFL